MAEECSQGIGSPAVTTQPHCRWLCEGTQTDWHYRRSRTFDQSDAPVYLSPQKTIRAVEPAPRSQFEPCLETSRRAMAVKGLSMGYRSDHRLRSVYFALHRPSGKACRANGALNANGVMSESLGSICPGGAIFNSGQHSLP